MVWTFFAIFALRAVVILPCQAVPGAGHLLACSLHQLQCSVPAETTQQQSQRAALPLPARRLVTGNIWRAGRTVFCRAATKTARGVRSTSAQPTAWGATSPVQFGARGERCSAALPPKQRVSSRRHKRSHMWRRDLVSYCGLPSHQCSVRPDAILTKPKPHSAKNIISN